MGHLRGERGFNNLYFCLSWVAVAQSLKHWTELSAQDKRRLKEMKSCMLLMNIPPSFLLYDVSQHHLRPATENQMVIGLIRHLIDIYSQQKQDTEGTFQSVVNHLF